VPNFVDEFDRLITKPQARESRLKLYTALINASLPLNAEGLPAQKLLIGHADVAQTTFYAICSESSTPNELLLACLPTPSPQNRVRRIVQEAKEYTATPWVRGWRDQIGRMRLRPQMRAETLVQVCTAWALRYPLLAAMDDCGLPRVISEGARSCFAGGSSATPPPDLPRFLTVIRTAQTYVLGQPASMSLEGLESVRSEICAIHFEDGDLVQKEIETYHMVAEYMIMVRGRYQESNPALASLLERAADDLRSHRDPAAQPDSDTPTPESEQIA
jgi:hypothetical protein